MINYFLIISLLLNSILIMVVLGVLPFLLYISALFNFLLVIFVVAKINETKEIREDTLVIFKKIEEFTNHIDKLYQLDTFYGDQDLQNLITHSRQIINDIIDVQEKYYDDIEVTLETYDDDEDKNEEEESPQEEE